MLVQDIPVKLFSMGFCFSILRFFFCLWPHCLVQDGYGSIWLLLLLGKKIKTSWHWLPVLCFFFFLWSPATMRTCMARSWTRVCVWVSVLNATAFHVYTLIDPGIVLGRFCSLTAVSFHHVNNQVKVEPASSLPHSLTLSFHLSCYLTAFCEGLYAL